ncbi:hypothetical protein H5392_02410 [Tessaracoccus sp. MC1865]|uniref:hypothetical protein n=1 Tax=Tessaracoccus sp. MC1865 TaxID=2760310 RepID=UPI00160089AE|nr:hypothetical protein [Tessaracoccus sp. MC1865]MBB1482713.1 hypothetical protein [Tessaracoccus sp. MC1865]QTO37838.1 hypothetical protein J7D54_01680 [Tessaracoccus sp. MC1865]
MSTSARRAAAWAAVGVLALAGCTPAADERTESTDLLREYIGATARPAGFTVTDEWRLEVVGGEPPETQKLYPTEGSSLADPAAPITVPRDDFPLDDSIELAEAQIDACDGAARVAVRALSPGIVVAEAQCDGQGSVFLDGKQLEPITEPISGAALTQVWSEIDRAGLTDEALSVEIDTEEGSAVVSVRGVDKARIYQWSRGLDAASTSVASHPLPSDGPAPEPAPLPPAGDLASAVDGLLGSLPDPSLATRLEVQRDGGVTTAILESADYTQLSSATFNG